MSVLEFKESPIPARVGETFNWDFDITPWAASGSDPVVSAINQNTGANITSTIFPNGSPQIVGTTYTLPEAVGWVKNVPVVITAQFESGGNTLRPYFIVQVIA